MNRERIILYFDRAIMVFLCLVVFCLPFSKAGIESFLWPAIFLWILKRVFGYKGNSFLGLPKTNLNKALGIFIAVILLSVVFSENIGLSLRGFFGKELKFLAIYFMLVEVVTTKERLKSVLIVFVSSAVFIAADAAIQYFYGVDFIRGFEWARSRASFSTSNGFAAWLIVVIPLFLGFLALGKGLSKKLKFLLSILVILLLICLLATYARGAWLGFVIGILFMFFYLFKNLKLKTKLLLLFFSVGLLAVFLILPHSLKSKITAIGRLNFRSYVTINERIKSFIKIEEGGSNLVRLRLWSEALRITRDFPLVGCGLNTYATVAKGYKSFDQGGIYPHNSYLHMSAETGLLGLFAFLFVLSIFFKTGIRRLNKVNDMLILGLLSGVLAFLVQSFSDDLLYSLQLVVLFWYMLGLTIAVIKLETEPGQNSGG